MRALGPFVCAFDYSVDSTEIAVALPKPNYPEGKPSSRKMEPLKLLASSGGVVSVSELSFLLSGSPCCTRTTARVAIWQAKTLTAVGRMSALEEFKSALKIWRKTLAILRLTSSQLIYCNA